MEITPIKDKVLVELQPAETVSGGGIHIPECSQEANLFGTVCATGELVTSAIADGDEVLILRTSGTHFLINGVDYIIVREKDIRAKATAADVVA